MAPSDPEEAVRLRSMQRIAETLGIPVEAFYREGEAARRAAQTDEMFRLWSALKSVAARENFLERARVSVAAQ